MSSAFTTLSADGDGQLKTVGNELLLAYSERLQAVGGVAYDTRLAVGDDAQDKTSWLYFQNWLESNCIWFIDHVNGPLTADKTSYLKFTKTTWQQAAGLNVSAADGGSFRRKVNPGDAFSYGHIQAGDYRGGSWVFEDLQKGFGALRWTLPLSVTYQGTGKRFAEWGGSFGVVCAAAVAVQQAAWEAASWTPAGSVYSVSASLFPDPYSGGFKASATRYCGTVTLLNIPTFCPSAAECYVRANSYASTTYEDMDNVFSGATYLEFMMWQGFPEDTVTSRVTDEVGRIDTNPIGLSVNAVCPTGGGGTCYGSEAIWILKWNFTNQ